MRPTDALRPNELSLERSSRDVYAVGLCAIGGNADALSAPSRLSGHRPRHRHEGKQRDQHGPARRAHSAGGSGHVSPRETVSPPAPHRGHSEMQTYLPRVNQPVGVQLVREISRPRMNKQRARYPDTSDAVLY